MFVWTYGTFCPPPPTSVVSSAAPAWKPPRPARTSPRTSSAKSTHATPPRAKVMPMNRPAHRLPIGSMGLSEGLGAHNCGERTVRRKGPGRWFKTDQGPLYRHHGRDEGRYHRGAQDPQEGRGPR